MRETISARLIYSSESMDEESLTIRLFDDISSVQATLLYKSGVHGVYITRTCFRDESEFT